MAEYESIHGTKVKYLSSDPTLDSSTEGQVWYNSTSGTNKSLVQIKAWRAGGTMPTATNNNGSATQGTQTASLSFGGGATTSQTIEYNGYAWTTSGNLGTGRFVLSGAGVQTAALGFGGYRHPPGVFENATEEYDGSSWTAGGNLGTARASMGGNGTQTAALAVTGAPLSPGTQCEEYGGTSWTAGGAYPVAQQSIAVAGPQTAALGAGGISGGPENGSTLVCNYDGSSWTVVSGTIPNGQNRAAYAGTQTHAVVFGGNINTPPPAGPGTPGIVTTATNEWDGSTFTITANMATARQSYAGAGTATSAIGFAGDKNPGASDDTEEYNSNINALTKAAWSSGGSIPTSHRDGFVGSIGTLDAGIAFGGEPLNSEAYLYNGTSWTDSGATMGTNVRLGAGMGTQTAAGSAGGNASVGYSQTGVFQNFNGSSWSEGPDMVTARAGAAGAGTLTAALASSGTSTSNTIVGDTEEYNGSSWSEQNNTGTARIYFSGCGTQTAALIFGGSTTSPAPFTPTANTEEYNGTSWTAGGALITPLGVHGASGTQTAALGFGGTPTIAGGAGSGYQNVQKYDGTSWSRTASMANAQNAFRGTGGTLTGTYAGGGYNASGSNVGTTEEFVDGTETVTASTLTTS